MDLVWTAVPHQRKWYLPIYVKGQFEKIGLFGRILKISIISIIYEKIWRDIIVKISNIKVME